MNSLKKGCLVVGGLATLGVIGIVVLLLTSDADGRAPTIDFTDCSADEEAHITAIYQGVFEDREQFYDFAGLNRLSGKSNLEMQRKLMRVWPLEIACEFDNDCPYGANTRGWVVGGDAKLTMCAYTRPQENDCDTYAGIAFANAYTRGLRDSESAGFFAYARQLCMARLAAKRSPPEQ